jgi:HlyD family secretion protein
LNGVVKQISADVSEDQKTGTRYYTLRISVPEIELKRLDNLNLKLIPGMPVEAFVKTNPRTVFTFLTKTLGDQIALAFREK